MEGSINASQGCFVCVADWSLEQRWRVPLSAVWPARSRSTTHRTPSGVGNSRGHRPRPRRPTWKHSRSGCTRL